MFGFNKKEDETMNNKISESEQEAYTYNAFSFNEYLHECTRSDAEYLKVYDALYKDKDEKKK